MVTKLLVAGAINTDLTAFVDRAPVAGETVAGGYFEQHGGGKGANQAVAAARSGSHVSLVSAVGDDDFGRARLQDLTTEGIDCSPVTTIKGVASGIALIIVESSGENRICDLPGTREHLTPEACLQVYERVQPSAILATNELPTSCLVTLFARAGRDHTPVWFNAAPFSPHVGELLPYVETLIVNRGECVDILGGDMGDVSPTTLLQGLRQLSINRAILTLGDAGLVAFDGHTDFSLGAEPAHVVDTTGAGDTFCGAWASRMLGGSSFEQALRYASRAAAISVSRRGAQTSIPTWEEIEAP